jgi:hypothetical protein
MRTIDCGEYGEIYRRVFGEDIGGAACRQGWKRWTKIWETEDRGAVLRVADTPAPVNLKSDYFMFMAHGPLPFFACVAKTSFPGLPARWIRFTDRAGFKEIYGSDLRRAAQRFLLHALVDGHGLSVPLGSAMVAGIAWLMANRRLGLPLERYHYMGFDITYVPGPPNRPEMFDFRAMLSIGGPEAEGLAALRAMPLRNGIRHPN